MNNCVNSTTNILFITSRLLATAVMPHTGKSWKIFFFFEKVQKLPTKWY